MNEFVYLFNSPSKSKFCSAVFKEKIKADEWIKKYKLSGILTLYPVNTSVYDWAIENKMFIAVKLHEITSDFIASFSTASQEHWHYENGVCENED